MKRLREVTTFLVLAAMIVALLAAVSCAIYLPLANHGAHVACLRLGENLGAPTRYVGLAPFGHCDLSAGVHGHRGVAR